MENVKELWIDIVSKQSDLLPENIYTLLKPEDRNAFFEAVKTLKPEYRFVAVQYLIEWEKENKSSNTSTIINYPINQPINVPYIPSTPLDPIPTSVPWQLPQVWCTTKPCTEVVYSTGTGIGHFYSQTN